MRLLKMQPDNHHFRVNITTNKKYILRPEKIGFEVQNPLFHIFCKLSFYIFSVIKYEPFGDKRSMRSFRAKMAG